MNSQHASGTSGPERISNGAAAPNPPPRFFFWNVRVQVIHEPQKTEKAEATLFCGTSLEELRITGPTRLSIERDAVNFGVHAAELIVWAIRIYIAPLGDVSGQNLGAC